MKYRTIFSLCVTIVQKGVIVTCKHGNNIYFCTIILFHSYFNYGMRISRFFSIVHNNYPLTSLFSIFIIGHTTFQKRNLLLSDVPECNEVSTALALQTLLRHYSGPGESTHILHCIDLPPSYPRQLKWLYISIIILEQ